MNLKSMLPTQKLIPGNMLFGDLQGGQSMVTVSGGSGKDKSSDAASALNTTSGKSVLQQASHQAPANHFLVCFAALPFSCCITVTLLY